MSTEALLPYLNPDYWDGHTIGHGEPLEPWPLLPASAWSLQRSRTALQLRVSQMSDVVPVETYGNGESFDPNSHATGTLVRFREESLFGDPGRLGVDVEQLKEIPVPLQPVAVPHNFGHTASRSRTVEGLDGFVYVSSAKWGVVSGSGRRRTLESVGTGVVVKLGDGRVSTPGLRSFDRTVKVGDTRHYAGWGPEWLHRVNVLEVVARGRREARIRKFGGLTGQLAVRHGAPARPAFLH